RRLSRRTGAGGGSERRGTGLPVRPAYGGAVARARRGAKGRAPAGFPGACRGCRGGIGGGGCFGDQGVAGVENESDRRCRSRGKRRRSKALRCFTISSIPWRTCS